MAFGRSNSLSINTGATNSLLYVHNTFPSTSSFLAKTLYITQTAGPSLHTIDSDDPTALYTITTKPGTSIENARGDDVLGPVCSPSRAAPALVLTLRAAAASLFVSWRTMSSSARRPAGGNPLGRPFNARPRPSPLRQSTTAADVVAGGGATSVKGKEKATYDRPDCVATGPKDDDDDVPQWAPMPALTDNNTSAQTQNQSTATSQPQQSGSLFDRITPADPARQTSNVFGSAATSQPQQSGGLFGSTTTSQPQQSGGLFGGAASTSQQQSNTGGTGLFGSSQSQPQQQQQQPQNQGGGLFGSSMAQPQQQQQQSTGGTGLFGSTLNPPQQQQQNQSSSLFGSNTNRQTTGLFGASTNNTNTGTGTGTGSSLFGGTTAVNSGGSSLFGSTQRPQQQQQSNSLFGAGAQTQQPQPTSSIFNLTATQPSYNQPSLLGASQYRQSQYPPFSGKLTLGQPTTNTTNQSQVQGAVKIDMNTLRPTTRFGDIVPGVQNDLERMDHMIQQQERFCREIQAFIPQHGADIATLAPDVALIADKAEAVEAALSLDAGNVDRERQVLEKDARDGERIQRVVDNQRLPAQYRYTGTDNKDMDLIGHFFIPMAADLQKTLGVYEANLAEIEAHMRVMEVSALGQAQSLAARRGGVAAAASSSDTVADLADTLRGFEASILGAAGLVGQCRDGVNELVLGR